MINNGCDSIQRQRPIEEVTCVANWRPRSHNIMKSSRLDQSRLAWYPEPNKDHSDAEICANGTVLSDIRLGP